MFNLGLPDILNINLVLKLNKVFRNNGKEVIRWIIKKSGFCLLKIFLKELDK